MEHLVEDKDYHFEEKLFRAIMIRIQINTIKNAIFQVSLLKKVIPHKF